jgi:hypothetical protein
MANWESFLPHCRWIILSVGDNAPYDAANDKETIIRKVKALPEADRERYWVVDRLATDRAPFDHPHSRPKTYGWP